MLVEQKYRECAAFIHADIEHATTGEVERLPVATAFFVGVPIGHGSQVGYAVTARHVAERTLAHGAAYVRLNLKAGGFTDLRIEPDAWTCHSSTDVALARINFVSHAEMYLVSASELATDEVVQQRAISEGDEVFFTGLFVQHPGVERNHPIVRFGAISLMPREPLSLKLDPHAAPTQVDAYLVESRSWGGHSGSPAFVYFPTERRMHSRYGSSGPEPGPYLLGLVHGHYDIEQDIAFSGDVLGSGRVPVNAGIAVVIPAQKILDLLMLEEHVDERREIAAEAAGGRPVPTPDSVLAESSSDPAEFDRFEDLTRKLVNVPKKELDEKRKDES